MCIDCIFLSFREKKLKKSEATTDIEKAHKCTVEIRILKYLLFTGKKFFHPLG